MILWIVFREEEEIKLNKIKLNFLIRGSERKKKDREGKLFCGFFGEIKIKINRNKKLLRWVNDLFYWVLL